MRIRPSAIRCLTAMTASLLASFHAFAATTAENVFKQHCGGCHLRAASAVRNLKGSSIEQRTSVLEEFLQSHHAADSKLRAIIIEYLIGLTEQ
jgi:hypothetical protein